jgi:hypothetical protein
MQESSVSFEELTLADFSQGWWISPNKYAGDETD